MLKLEAGRLNRLAVAVLWLRTLSVLALAVFVYVQGGPNVWLTLPDLIGSALVLALWTELMVNLLSGKPVLTTDSRRRAIGLLYPWLIAYQGALWFLWLLGALVGAWPEANPLALTVIVTTWGASIAVSFLVFLLSLRLMANPADQTGRGQLSELLNLAAALSAANLVMNLVTVAGLKPSTLASQWAYGLAGIVELASLLLLYQAFRRQEPEHVAGEAG